MATQLQKILSPEAGNDIHFTAPEMLPFVAKVCFTKAKWVTKFGIPATKFVDVWEKENAKTGAKNWTFAVWHKEETCKDKDISDVKAMASVGGMSCSCSIWENRW